MCDHSTPERVAVFIDGSNAYHASKSAFGSGKYDLLKLARGLATGRPLVRIGYYIGAVPQQMEANVPPGRSVLPPPRSVVAFVVSR